MESLIKSLYEGSLRVQEAAATAIASLSYCEVRSENQVVKSMFREEN